MQSQLDIQKRDTDQKIEALSLEHTQDEERKLTDLRQQLERQRDESLLEASTSAQKEAHSVKEAEITQRLAEAQRDSERRLSDAKIGWERQLSESRGIEVQQLQTSHEASVADLQKQISELKTGHSDTVGQLQQSHQQSMETHNQGRKDDNSKAVEHYESELQKAIQSGHFQYQEKNATNASQC